MGDDVVRFPGASGLGNLTRDAAAISSSAIFCVENISLISLAGR